MITQDMQKFSDKLKKLGIKYEFINHPPIRSVEEGLLFLGIQAADGVSTLILRSDDQFIAVLRRDDNHLDLERIQKLTGGKQIRLADQDEVVKVTGYPVGATPLINDLPMLMDETILKRKTVYGGTGSFEYDIKISSQDLLKVTKARVVDIVVGMRKRILTGDTPTGKLHLGHYVGTLENRVKLQDQYETFIILADLHSFTTLADQPQLVHQSTLEVAIDNLAVGLDPKKVHIFIESQIPEIYELAAIYSMLVPLPRAMRNPTIKDEIKMKGLGENYSLGFLNYPIYQAADITCVGANLVPVGKDQLPHIEQTREIVDKINSTYGEVLVKPVGLVGKIGKLVGTDGSPKMSKSLGNTIMLSDSAQEVKKKVMSMFTDPTRIHPTDPGHVEGNPVFIYHDAFNPNKEEIKQLKERYRQGTVGDIEVKEKLVRVINELLEPIRERRLFYENHPDEVRDILAEGTRVAREEAKKTLEAVREVTKLEYGLTKA
jgi:tryptophanyl-tRNA synthetase